MAKKKLSAGKAMDGKKKLKGERTPPNVTLSSSDAVVTR